MIAISGADICMTSKGADRDSVSIKLWQVITANTIQVTHPFEEWGQPSTESRDEA